MSKSMKSRLLTAVVVLSIGLLLGMPGFSSAAEVKPGDVIDSSNIDQYKDYFPMFMQRYIKDGWGIDKPVVIKVKEPEFVGFTKGYLEASKKNMETCKLTADGLLDGYGGAGAPFLEPKEPNIAIKIMWNQFYKNFPDDWLIPGSYLSITKRKGSSRVTVTDSQYEQCLFSNRTMLDPMPELDNPKALYYANKLNSKTPPNKDMATLSWRYKDPLKFDDMWTYVPTLRRTLRLVSSERANPIRGTPYTWDDIFGFDGKIPLFTYAFVGEQTMLSLMSQKITAENVDRKNFPWHPVLHEGEEYEIVDCYILEITSKDPRYPQSRKTVWVDKKKFGVLYAQMYDKGGNFWKGFWNGNRIISLETTHGKEPYRSQYSSGITDFKTSYWVETITGLLELNIGTDPSYFQPGALGTF
jgi:hypothetical protein